MAMVFDEMVLPVCGQGYLIPRETVISLSLLVDGIFCSLLSVGLYLSLHFALCHLIIPFSFLSVLLKY